MKLTIISKKELQRLKEFELYDDKVQQLYWFSEFTWLEPLTKFFHNVIDAKTAREEMRQRESDLISKNHNKIRVLTAQVENLIREKQAILDTIELKKEELND